ncbi:MAG: hypothetical protein ACHQHO_00330 [Solirubrobacterales bacterium]
MTHISRPIQIALAAAVLFLAVWFFALRGHSSASESSGSGSSGSVAQSSASSGQSSASQSTPGGGSPASKGGVYHGSAPGVEGLSRAIQKARGAVAQSQQNAQQQGSQASGTAQKQNSGSQSSQSQGAQTQHRSQSRSSQSQTSQSQISQQQQTQAQQNQSRQAESSQQTKAAAGVPPMQAAIEGELKHGKVVAVLFWNPQGSVDATVRRELRAASRPQHGKLAVHVARSSQIGSFGSFAHAVQVYSTPTILLINTHGKTSSLTGLTDAFSIAQAINEVKRAK